MTETIVVERRFDQPTDLAPVRAAEEAVAWCLEQHRVRHLHTYLAVDRRAMVCVYRAPDAEAVRATQHRAGLPVERAWAATLIGESAGPPGEDERVLVVGRGFDEPMTADVITGLYAQHGHCLEMHRAELVVSHLARDGRRMLCVFIAPDAETVRLLNRQLGFPVEQVWPATVHRAPP